MANKNGDFWLNPWLCGIVGAFFVGLGIYGFQGNTDPVYSSILFILGAILLLSLFLGRGKSKGRRRR